MSGDVELQGRLDVPVRSPRADLTSRIRRTGWPAPFHLVRALAGYGLLSTRERLSVLRGALALRAVDPDDPRVDEMSFGGFLAAHAQSARSVEALWDLVGVATLNAPASAASLSLAATVFQQGLLNRADAGDLGWSRVPLGRLHGEAAGRALGRAGAQVRCRCKVTGLRAYDRGWQVTTSSGGTTEELAVDHVVLAVPAAASEALLPAGALALAPGWAAQLGSSPIVNVHVILDRVVLREPFLATVDSPLQFVFDRSGPSGLREGQYLAVSLSAADRYVDLRAGDLRDLVLPALHQLLPRSVPAEILEVFVTRERNATFRPAPGSRRFRPGTATHAPGLFLAGAWTDTGWPATMEGAVRSGEAAAAAVLAAGRREDHEVAA